MALGAPAGKRPTPSMDPRLAAELRRLRRATGMPGYAAAEKLGWSESKISRIENMRSGVAAGDVGLLLDLYGADPEERATLVELAERSAEMAVKGSPRAAKAEIWRTEASQADVWAPHVVPPLLRTPEYAAALAEAAAEVTMALPSEIAGQLRVVSSWRRRIEARYQPLKVRAVLDATALRRRVGGKAVMRGQVQHLAWLDSRPNVTLRVLPLDAAAPVGLAAFTLLRFGLADGGLPLDDVALFDDEASPRADEDEQAAYRCRRAVRELIDAAEEPGGAVAAALAHW